MNETTKLLPFEVLKNIKKDYIRVTQSFNDYVGFYIQSSDLHKSSENNFFIKISRDIIFKYVVVAVAAKMSVKFSGSIIEIPKNRSKFSKNAILTSSGFLYIKALALFSCCMGFVGNASKMLFADGSNSKICQF